MHIACVAHFYAKFADSLFSLGNVSKFDYNEVNETAELLRSFYKCIYFG